MKTLQPKSNFAKGIAAIVAGVLLSGLATLPWTDPSRAQTGASLYVTPASGSHQFSTNFSVNVYVNSGGEPTNAVMAELSYNSGMLDFVSQDSTSSAFGIQASQSGGGGLVKFERGSTTPLTGTALLVGKINFKTKTTAGSTPVGFTGNSVVVHSSTFQNMLGSTSGGTYTVNSPPAPNPSPSPSPTPPTPSPSPSPGPSPSPSPGTPPPSPSSNPSASPNPAPGSSPPPANPSSPGSPSPSPSPTAPPASPGAVPPASTPGVGTDNTPPTQSKPDSPAQLNTAAKIGIGTFVVIGAASFFALRHWRIRDFNSLLRIIKKQTPAQPSATIRPDSPLYPNHIPANKNSHNLNTGARKGHPTLAELEKEVQAGRLTNEEIKHLTKHK